jgi:hypothetical protein
MSRAKTFEKQATSSNRMTAKPKSFKAQRRFTEASLSLSVA